MPNWHDMFVPTSHLTEVIARASIMYLLLFGALRFLLKREGGAVNIADLLVVVAVVDGAQPAFTGKAESITESVVFVLTVVFWSYLLNWLGFHVRALDNLTAGAPMVLIKDGELNLDNMRKALITRSELDAQLRLGGVETVEEVRLALLEGDGQVSVIPRDRDAKGKSELPALS